MATDVITVAELGVLGPQLGEGGQARVFQAPGVRLPDASGPLVFKQYRPGHHPPYGLRKLVAVRNGLDAASRRRLDQYAAWPLRVVEDGGRVCGVVLPLIPPTFFQPRTLPGSGRQEHAPREVQNLLIPAQRAWLVGMPTPSARERIGICRDFAAVLHFVHRNNLVIGDLNARNALFRLGESPSVMLVDCDAIRIKGNAAVVAQLNAPDWDPPERPLTQYSDLYKFGLFVLRCLGTGEQLSTTRDASRADGALDPEGRRLLREALNGIPAQRPTAQVWGRYFQYLLTGQRAPTQPTPAVTVSPLRTETVTTTGWARDPATGQWKQR